MTYIHTITSISKTLKKFLFHKSLHYSYIQTGYNDKEEITNNTFIKYDEPLLNYINHPALIQEWKLNLYASAYEKKIDSGVYKPSSKKEIDRHDSDSYWPTSIKDKINWFKFLKIIEHNANTLKPHKGIITSLLKLFAMFQLHLFYYKYNK